MKPIVILSSADLRLKRIMSKIWDRQDQASDFRRHQRLHQHLVKAWAAYHNVSGERPVFGRVKGHG